jgi:cysteinyl-tRNA synthetase
MQITNTLSGKKEQFVPADPHNVSMYVCGITPYDFAHVGHARVYITFDVLYRLLTFLGYNVTYCRNYTDIDDKLLNKAEKEFGDQMKYKEVAQKYIDAYQKNMQQLNCRMPSIEPRVTTTIPQIIDFVQELINKGCAYIVDGDVYYSVRSFPDYGKLSKRNIEDLQAGARVEINEKKHDALDFALWKGEEQGTFWKSPWGWGRPGWHIECSAMSSHFLAPHIDIHGGGMDLIFPHHENEIAQSEGLHGKPFARYWIHNAFVRINKEKMSKSLGNFFTIQDVLKEFDPMVIRFYILNHNYNIPLDFSFDDIKAYEKTYKRLCSELAPTDNLPLTDNQTIKHNEHVNHMLAFLEDDLNIAGMFGYLFKNSNEIKKDAQHRAAIALFLQQVLGLTLAPIAEKTVTITQEMQQLIDEREQARVVKDWKKSDALRDRLRELGYEVQDKKK